jgi:3-methylfumaryl-CoA hydratase
MSRPDDWIGRSWRRSEQITERQLAHFRATLAGTLGPGAVPPGFHWCLVPDLAEPEDLGRDGHPKPGLFVPEMPLPRRMWAGGTLRHAGTFNPGDIVTRMTSIADIASKTGATGPLAFLKVRHLWSVDGSVRIDEIQDIVYREDPKPGAIAPAPKPAEDWPGAHGWDVTPDPVLLFRYSALTFNGHRIHYDFPYATGVEGYCGLVVHGPLQAVWMLNLATRILGHLPATYTYRGVSPLICGEPVTVEAREEDDGLSLRVRKADGVVTMQASARTEL